MKDAPDAVELTDVKGQVDVDHVSFAYEGDLDVLHDVDLHIKAGETLAVVGPSGGGKSTLCKLIPRFYDVTDGDIRIDGQNVRHVTQRSLRQQVGVVQQDVFLFADSILNNIRCGKPEATEEEVIRAAQLAEIYDDIRAMPDGLETYVGERGTLLSGGQKQRISIARIFLKNPPVLILDEATSALDSVTEREIQFLLDQGSTLVFFRDRWIEVDRYVLREALRALQAVKGKPLTVPEAVSFALGTGHVGRLRVAQVKAHGWLRGLLNELRGEKRQVIAVIGDGALTGRSATTSCAGCPGSPSSRSGGSVRVWRTTWASARRCRRSPTSSTRGGRRRSRPPSSSRPSPSRRTGCASCARSRRA